MPRLYLPNKLKRLSDKVESAESVTSGHPDKVADQISDGVLDAMYEECSNPNSEYFGQDPRVAAETLVSSKDLIVLAGEITPLLPDSFYQDVTKKVIADIGYNSKDIGLDYRDVKILVDYKRQSNDIAQGVDSSFGDKEQGAGDQGMMTGYAIDETPTLMPLPIYLAHNLAEMLEVLRRSGKVEELRPDGKSQVNVDYNCGNPWVRKLTLAAQHEPGVTLEDLYFILMPYIMDNLGNYFTEDTEVCINGTGVFEKGGPDGDTGLTGRKIVVDQYGSRAPVGGGAFSGKDPSKVDRSGAYMARHIAKNIVAAGLTHECFVEIGYTIGVAEPTGLIVQLYGLNGLAKGLSPEKLELAVRNEFPLKPAELIDYFDLKKPIYRDTATYGHMGREPVEKSGNNGCNYTTFPWEKTNRVEDLQKYLP